jgi:hypothetical protein
MYRCCRSLSLARMRFIIATPQYRQILPTVIKFRNPISDTSSSCNSNEFNSSGRKHRAGLHCNPQMTVDLVLSVLEPFRASILARYFHIVSSKLLQELAATAVNSLDYGHYHDQPVYGRRSSVEGYVGIYQTSK